MKLVQVVDLWFQCNCCSSKVVLFQLSTLRSMRINSQCSTDSDDEFKPLSSVEDYELFTRSIENNDPFKNQVVS